MRFFFGKAYFFNLLTFPGLTRGSSYKSDFSATPFLDLPPHLFDYGEDVDAATSVNRAPSATETEKMGEKDISFFLGKLYFITLSF